MLVLSKIEMLWSSSLAWGKEGGADCTFFLSSPLLSYLGHVDICNIFSNTAMHNLNLRVGHYTNRAAVHI